MTPIVVLDGGMGTELTARGHDLSDRLWSARVLLTDPGAIEDVHLAYFEAGATVATTASYQASIDGFAEVGLGREAALELDPFERGPGAPRQGSGGCGAWPERTPDRGIRRAVRGAARGWVRIPRRLRTRSGRPH